MNREILLEVEGMSCGSCVRHVDAALRKIPGVATVEVRLREGEVTVAVDATGPDAGTLVAALVAEGYPARAA